MPLRGWFEEPRQRPLINCTVILPRLGAEAELTLLVDTGADRTMLAPMEVALLGVDPRLLVEPGCASGVGGVVSAFRETAIITFTDGLMAYRYQLPILIVTQETSGRATYSILGRDILNRWHMNYRPTERRLEFDVVSADDSLDLDV